MTLSTSGAGPRVVAIGGGHGLAATLKAVRTYAGEVTAIVSAADDGGSSGRLRHANDIPPPGDLRRCLVALGDEESLWGRAFEHRFEAGDLQGHPVGNLVIAGLAATAADFMVAVDEAARLVGARGRVLPATLCPVVLGADTEQGRVMGQVSVGQARGISRVFTTPVDADTPPAAVEAIATADQIVIGPGSLYTSVLAAAVVPPIAGALKRATGRKVHVCNLRPQPPETERYDVAAHVAALAAHGLDVDVVLWDPATMDRGDVGVACHSWDLARPNGAAHDPEKLGEALAALVV